MRGGDDDDRWNSFDGDDGGDNDGMSIFQSFCDVAMGRADCGAALTSICESSRQTPGQATSKRCSSHLFYFDPHGDPQGSKKKPSASVLYASFCLYLGVSPVCFLLLLFQCVRVGVCCVVLGTV